MAGKFSFNKTDATVIKYLTAEDISEVQRWQTNAEYEFEFHDGHTQNHPIYIRPVGNSDTELIPKIITMNHSKSNYKTILSLYNGKKLKEQLSNAACKEILDIIDKSWDSIAKFTKNYWTGAFANVVQQVRPTYKCLACDTQFHGEMKGEKKQGKYKCTSCYEFKVVGAL